MRLLYWLLCAAAAIFPVLTSEEKSLARPKRESSEKKIVCYYTNWSVYRPGTAKFSPQNINPYLCTHLIYAFGGLSKDNALKPFDKYQDIEQGGYAKFNGLKTYNKNLKTMLAIGGWNEGSARFSPLVADPERRRELVKNTVKFLRQNHFDGLDLDWEYPSFRDGGKPRDRDNYASLVQEFREEFEKESEKTGRTRLLLTMAVPAGIEYIDKGYDVPKLNKYLDWMNILSYDYHSAFEPVINHHSPLLSLEEDDEYNFDAQLNIDYTVQHYIKLGADRHKLVLGIPTYGRSYSLFNPDSTEIGSPADGPGEQGDATREKGYLAYYEICERIKSDGWTVENPNPEAMGPYAYKGNQWVGYDDEDIARAKAKYVNDNDLGGIMFWSIDNDDFRGKCHGKPYPLIEAAKEALLASANELIPATSRSDAARSNSKAQEESSPKPKTRKTRPKIKTTTTTEASKSKSKRTTTTPQPPTTPDPGSDFICKDEGFFPHPRDCKKYFWCLDSGPSSLGLIAHQFTCPSGLVFNKVSDSCDYARNVVCKTKSESPSTTSTTTTSTTTTTTTPRPTTVRSKLVITASPPRTTSTTTTTTTQAPEVEEDEEEDEEDPGTIKELINLIKKLGGVEQLEKQLNLQNSNEKERIKPSLYSKVLQGRTANRYRGVVANEELSTPKYVSSFRNRPVGPQSPSTEEISTSTKGQDKPRYVTIQRNRGTKKPKVDEEEIEDEEEEEVVEEEKPKKKTDVFRPSRRRPSTEATTTEKEYVSLRRARPPKTEEVSTSRYQNIVRVRSTTEAVAEEEEEEEIVEEDDEEEEEEETEDEQQPKEAEKEVNEPVQKYKKYSSIIRDSNKKVSEEEDTKVSGPVGPHSTNGSQTQSDLDERKIVNNVNTGTSPRYVEIRRRPTSTTTESSENVYTVNTEQNGIIEKTPVVNEVALEELNNLENDRNKFQQKSTTEIVKRSTVPSYRSSTIEKAQATNEPEKERRVPFFRFRSSTEASSTASLRKTNRYVTINRSSSEKPLENRPEPSQLPRRERIFRTSTTTTGAPVENPSTNGFRKFQFGPRTKPTILSPKPTESTTEVFTITVPDLPQHQLTENGLHLPNNLPSVPSATVEPEITTTFSLIDSTILSEPENAVDLAFNNKNSPSTRSFNPTTSTQTTVVTSITESAYTERKRFFIPKRLFRNNYDNSPTISSSTLAPREILDEVTKPLFSPPKYKTIVRSTTPKFDSTTEAKRARYNSKSTTTTTTTTTEVPEKRFIRKKTRNFKKITSTETPEFVPTSTQSLRFNFRTKPRQVEQGQIEPINSLNLRYSTNPRRKKVLSKEDIDEDLDVDQTSGFFDENTGRFILGGGLRQHSEKEFLNADIFFTNPPGDESANLANSTALTNSLEITDSPNHPTINNSTVTAGTKEPVRNKLLANLALRHLKNRAQQSRDKNTETATEKASTTTTFSPRSTKSKNNFFTFNPNLRNLRTRNQQTEEDEEQQQLDYASENDKEEDSNLIVQRQRSKFVPFSDERVKPTPSGIAPTQLLKTTSKDSKNVFKEAGPNSNNLRYLRGRSRQNNFSGRENKQGETSTTKLSAVDSNDTVDEYNSRSTRARPLLASRGLTAKQIETTTPPGFGTREPSKFDGLNSQLVDELNEENLVENVSRSHLEKTYQTTTPSGFGTRQTSKISTPIVSTSDFANGRTRSRPSSTFAPTEFEKVSQEIFSETTTPEGFGTRQTSKFFTTNSNLLSSTNLRTKAQSSTLVSTPDLGKSSREKAYEATTPSGLSTRPLSSATSRTVESTRGNQLSNKILPESLVEGSKNAQGTSYSNDSVQRQSTTSSGRNFSRTRGTSLSTTTTSSTHQSEGNGYRDRDSKYLGSRTRQNDEANEKQSQRTTTQVEGVKEQSLVTASVLPRRTRVRTIKKRIGGNNIGAEVTSASTFVVTDKSSVRNKAIDGDTTDPVNIQSQSRRPSLKGNGVADFSSLAPADTTVSSALDPAAGTTFGQKIDTTIPDSLGSSSFVSPSKGINFVSPVGSTFTSNTISTLGSNSNTGFPKRVVTAEGFAKPSTGTATGSTIRALSFPSAQNSTASIENRTRGTTKSLLPSSSPTQASFRPFRTRTQTNENKVTELNSEALNEVRATEEDVESDFDSSRSRGRSSTTARFTRPEKRINSNDESVANNTLSSSGFNRANFRNSINRFRATEKAVDSSGQATGLSSLNEIPHTDRKESRTGSQKSRRVLVKTRPIQSKLETKGGEDVDEKSEVQPVTLRPTTSRRNQEYTGARNKVRSTTTQAPSRERSEKRRTDLDRRRFRAELKSTSAKPDIQAETPSSVVRANTILRRRGRPTTSTTTTTTTTTTTEEPISEVEEDSSLEESKALEEDPDIQDLADPAVVAIHNLATVSPGPISASSLVSPSARPTLKFYSGTPDTYTVHVTPSDIASITPGRVSTISTGTARPTSILTLKPFTIPVITKQTPSSFRTPSPFRGTGIPLVTEEPLVQRSEILARRLETTTRPRPIPSVTAAPQKEVPIKPKKVKPFSKVTKQEVAQSVSSPEPPLDYEYYDDDDDPLANIPASALKVKVHSDGYIECLDRGNFPHPFSCKKFISCAKMENNELLGWEYTCPKHLSFDPVGGICNWSAGLGCQN